jgi:hypothetical protein
MHCSQLGVIPAYGSSAFVWVAFCMAHIIAFCTIFVNTNDTKRTEDSLGGFQPGLVSCSSSVIAMLTISHYNKPLTEYLRAHLCLCNSLT